MWVNIRKIYRNQTKYTWLVSRSHTCKSIGDQIEVCTSIQIGERFGNLYHRYNASTLTGGDQLGNNAKSINAWHRHMCLLHIKIFINNFEPTCLVHAMHDLQDYWSPLGISCYSVVLVHYVVWAYMHINKCTCRPTHMCTVVCMYVLSLCVQYV